MSNLVELEGLLMARLETMNEEKASLRSSLESTQKKIDHFNRILGPRPKGDLEEISKAIATLNHNYVTTSQSRSSDRTHMRDLAKLQQRKQHFIEYSKNSEILNELYAQQSAIYQDLTSKTKSINELYSGIRKVRAAIRLGLGTDSIVELNFPASTERIEAILGKGRIDLRRVESEFNVVIDIDRVRSDIKLLGLQESVDAATPALNVVLNSVSLEFTFPDEILFCILLNKASIVQEIQSRHRVRIDVSRSKGTCKISGLDADVGSAVEEISSVKSSSVIIPIEAKLVAFLLGRGLNVIRDLESSHSVSIDILRDDHQIVVIGFSEDVSFVTQELSNLINDNKEIEEVIEAEKYEVLKVVIGNGGSIAKRLQTEFGVRINVSKNEGGGGSSSSTAENIRITGVSPKVLVAKQKIMEVLTNFRRQTVVVDIPPEVIRKVIGKQGGQIRSICNRFPDVDVDFEETLAFIHSSNEASRIGVRDAIQEIIDSSHSEAKPLNQAAYQLLMGRRGQACRDRVYALNVYLSYDESSESLAMRGNRDAIADAWRDIQTFTSSNFSLNIPLSLDDCTALMGRPFPELERQFGIEIITDKKNCQIRLTGHEANVQAAKVVINGILLGDSSKGSVIVPINASSIPFLVGKQGASVHKFQDEYQVKLDILKAKSVVRIRGPQDKLLAATCALKSSIAEYRTSVEIPIQSFPREKVKTAYDTLRSLFRLDITLQDGRIQIRGPSVTVQEAKTLADHLLSGRSQYSIQLTTEQLQEMVTCSASFFDRLRSEYGVSIDIDEDLSAINVEGPTAAVTSVKTETYRLLEQLFPSEIATIEVDRKCLTQSFSPRTIIEIEESTSAFVQFDLESNALHLRGDAAHVTSAVASVQRRLDAWRLKHPVVSVESHVIGAILGKNLSQLNNIEQRHSVSVRVNPKQLQIEIDGRTEESAQAALSSLQDLISAIQGRHCEISVDPSLFGRIIGKNGTNVTKIQSECEVTLTIDKAKNIVRVQGSPEGIQKAKDAINEILDNERETNFSIVHPVPTRGFAVLIGQGGATVKDLQNEFNCSFQFDRDRNVVTIRGR